MNPEHISPRKDIVALIPEGTISVLDVGCAEATMFQELRNKGVTYYCGIDIINTPEFLSLIKPRLDRYIHCDLNRTVTFPFKDEEFDVIIFGDILEHVFDPWSVLERFVRHLKPNGTIIISIPNSLLHYSAFRKIITGTHSYQSSGLWDNTHIRFFSRRMVLGMINKAGLEVVKYVPNYEYDPWIMEKKPILMAMFNQILKFICFGSADKETVNMEDMDDFYVIQFVYTVKKKKVSQ